MDQRQEGVIKMVGGVVLAILGVIGLYKAKDIKHQGLRLIVSVLSAIAIGGGAYLFVLGADDLAVAKLDKPLPNEAGTAAPFVYTSPEAFKSSLVETIDSQVGNDGKKVHRNLRRLTFACPDKSKRFRVFVTAFGVFGVPSHSVECADGSYLVYYSKK